MYHMVSLKGFDSVETSSHSHVTPYLYWSYSPRWGNYLIHLANESKKSPGAFAWITYSNQTSTS
jgi:hypothetical protein